MTPLSATHRHFRHAIVSVVSFGACMVLAADRGDSEFMRYDAAARRVELTIIAAFDPSNSGYNFNGGSRGAHRITVPAGWRVGVTFVNRDVIPHSMAVVREERRVPTRIERLAFIGAASRGLATGLPTGARQDDIAFVADVPGAYVIACGVPGHAAVGSWLRLTVSADATVPTYEMTPSVTRSVSHD